jgi:hypothetical protein
VWAADSVRTPEFNPVKPTAVLKLTEPDPEITPLTVVDADLEFIVRPVSA